MTAELPQISNHEVVREETSSDDSGDDTDDTSPLESKEVDLSLPLPPPVAPPLLPVAQIPVVFSLAIEPQQNALLIQGEVTNSPVSTSVPETVDTPTLPIETGYSRGSEAVVRTPRFSLSEQSLSQPVVEEANYAARATTPEPISSSPAGRLPKAVSPREVTVPAGVPLDRAVLGKGTASLSPDAREAAPPNRAVPQPAQEPVSVPASFEAPTVEASVPARVAVVGTQTLATPVPNRSAVGIVPTAVVASPASTLPASEARVAQAETAETEAIESIQVKTVSVASAEKTVTDSGKNSPAITTAAETSRGGEGPVQEKFAADLKLRRSSRSLEKQASPISDKKVVLTVDKEKVAERQSAVGTETAKELAPMVHDIRQTRLIALGGETLPSASGVSEGATQAQPMADKTAETRATTAAANAVQVVRQISDAVDALAATERPGVNVRVKLDDVGVAVNVEFRNGEVRATFQTDSADLRDALSTAWQTHAAAVTDSKPYRFAEPVFTSSPSQNPGSQSSQSQSFSMGGDTSRQHQQQQQPHSQSSATELSPTFLSGVHQLRTSKATSPTPVAPASAVGASLSSRLEAFA